MKMWSGPSVNRAGKNEPKKYQIAPPLSGFSGLQGAKKIRPGISEMQA
jgi:hypothetical protein